MGAAITSRGGRVFDLLVRSSEDRDALPALVLQHWADRGVEDAHWAVAYTVVPGVRKVKRGGQPVDTPIKETPAEAEIRARRHAEAIHQMARVTVRLRRGGRIIGEWRHDTDEDRHRAAVARHPLGRDGRGIVRDPQSPSALDDLCAP